MKVFLLLSLLAVGAHGAIPIDRRIDCQPDSESTAESCLARGCVYDETTVGPIGTPKCYMRADEIGYTANFGPGGGEILTKNKGPSSPWGDDISSIRYRISGLGNGVLNVRIGTEERRYDPAPILNLPRETLPSDETLQVDIAGTDPFAIAVKRGDGSTLFDTSIGGLIFTDQFIQIAALLPSDKMYGWGENIHQSLKHDFTRYTSWGMFARGDAPNSTDLHTANLYGVHPFYLLLEPSGKAHGVFFLNTNAQDVTTLPAPGLVYRTTGGFLDMYFFPGPTPGQVIAQYHAFIGRPFMPSYWALGYQLCRWGYKSLDDLKSRVNAVMAAGIPLDVVYADIDYMDRRKDFTTDPEKWSGFNEYIDQLHSKGMSSILIFDPAVQADYDVFQRAKDKKVSFIEWERADQVQPEIQSQYPMANDTKIMLGLVWPDRHVAFPDFLDTTTATDEWWEDEFKRYYQQVKFDGAWIDMNEPQVFYTRNTPNDEIPSNGRYPVICPKTGPDAKWDSPPYQTHAVFYYGEDAFLGQDSLCLTGLSQRGTNRMYNTRNLYGWSESRSTSAVMEKTTGRRANVISRSTFASSGRYAGHWLGDNSATWSDLRTSISEAMEFNMFGLPYVGSDVCGFKGVSNEELCLRWHQMAAFHSFYRNHNAIAYPSQDPAVWPSVAAATKKANEFRYRYLPYLYNLHYRSSTLGDTVVRPLFFEYPLDEATHEISYQFMWGPSITVAPVYTQGATSVEAYIPAADTYFSLNDHNYGSKVTTGLNIYDAPTTSNAPTFVRAKLDISAASIIPRHQSSAITTTALRALPFSYLVVPGNGAASGTLFWDDGDSIVESWKDADYVLADLTYSSVGGNSLVVNVTRGTTTIIVPTLAELEIFDYPSAPDYSSFTLNGAKISVNTQASKYSAITKVFTVAFSQRIPLNKEGVSTIRWNNVNKS
ncbi:aagr-2 [Pristionchus pacificus]|uniref:Glycoside hydrolase n=1 Tax=Pristionchus pacificus TaxID=54126 RepID=A0A2A6BGL6_PRIPA|nr:aagr-2 [Pristionchus pacificus]|eukprot:PDM65019.1 glycoside hydrolase [Pristionchus pacificus]